MTCAYKKRRKDSRLILLYKGLKGKTCKYLQVTLSRRIGFVEINTLWHFRNHKLAKKRTKVVSFHRLSGTGITSLFLLSTLLKCLMTVCPNSHLLREPGTDFTPDTHPGEVLATFGVLPKVKSANLPIVLLIPFLPMVTRKP